MALEGKNGSLALGWSLYTCLPPCPKAELGTSIPWLSPKRGIKPETRALQCQSSTAPGNPSHRKLSAAPTFPSLRGTPSLPPCPPPPCYLHHHCFHIGRTEQRAVLCTHAQLGIKLPQGHLHVRIESYRLKVLRAVTSVPLSGEEFSLSIRVSRDPDSAGVFL